MDYPLRPRTVKESVWLACLAAGEPVILDDAEMDRVLDKFRDYGARYERLVGADFSRDSLECRMYPG